MAMPMIHSFYRSIATPPMDPIHPASHPGRSSGSVPSTESTVTRTICGVSIFVSASPTVDRIASANQHRDPCKNDPTSRNFPFPVFFKSSPHPFSSGSARRLSYHYTIPAPKRKPLPRKKC